MWGIDPKWMNKIDYKRYIDENKKDEWFRVRIPDITNPNGALHELKRRLKTIYILTPLGDNFVSFAEYIFEAVGSKYSESNIPSNVRDMLPKFKTKYSTPMIY